MTRRRVNVDALHEVTRVLTEPPGAAPDDDCRVIVERDVLQALGSLIPADAVTFDDLATRQRDFWAGSFSLPDDDAGWAYAEDFYPEYWAAPCSLPDRTGDWVSVFTLSDHVGQGAWRRSLMYGAIRAFIEFDREMIVPLPSPPGRSRRIRFLRKGGSDFDEIDRTLATLIRPHVAGYLHARESARTGAAVLTPRQRQLMSFVARGQSNTEIARTLGISAGTVRIHLQQIYERLGVNSRGEAVALLRLPAEVDVGLRLDRVASGRPPSRDG